MLAQHLSGWLDGLEPDVVNIGILSLALVTLLWHWPEEPQQRL